MRLLRILPLICILFLTGLDKTKIRAFREAWAAAGVDAEEQAEAILLLQGADSEEVARILAKIIGAKEIPFPVEDAVTEVMGGLRSEGALRHLAKQVHSHPRWQARVIIARALKAIREPITLDGLHRGMGHSRWAVRSAIVQAIGAIRSRDSIEPLIERLEKEEGRVAGEIHWALRRITGKDLSHVKEWKTWWASAKETFKVPPLGESGPKPVSGSGDTKTKDLYGAVISGRVIFVVDISESMKVVLTTDPDRGLSRLQIMKRELCRTVLYALPENAEFNVIAYATKVMPWKEKMVVSTQKNRSEACAWVEGLELSGETNMMGALDAALADKKVDTIYFLSDGSPSIGRIMNVRQILAEVRRQNGPRNVVIHTIALLGGDGKKYRLVESKPQARDFLQKLAERNGGTYTAFE